MNGFMISSRTLFHTMIVGIEIEINIGYYWLDAIQRNLIVAGSKKTQIVKKL